MIPTIVTLAMLGGSARMDVSSKSLAPVAFMVGNWRGEEAGELHEEHWTDARGDSMTGMYRWVDAQGKTRMCELLNLGVDPETESPVLRVRHFDATLTPWKDEANGPLVLKYQGGNASRAVFENTGADRLATVTYELADQATLKATINFKPESGRTPIVIAMKRAAAPASPPK